MHDIIRVFPRRTKATPDDALAFTTPPPKQGTDDYRQLTLDGTGGINPMPDWRDAKEVHVSVTFTFDIPKAEQLAESWHKAGFPTKMGGPAFGLPGGDFVPGLYLKNGYVITSRGCDKSCWFCSVPSREDGLRELPIQQGWNICDDNILACSENHIRAVFEMLKSQPQKPIFTGGLDSRLLREWHVNLLREVKVERMYFAYDTPADLEPLIQAGKLLRDGGIKNTSGSRAKCYVLIGYPGDTMEQAEKRLLDTWRAGLFPFAMLYRNDNGETSEDWKDFQRSWVRPHIVYNKLKTVRVPWRDF